MSDATAIVGGLFGSVLLILAIALIVAWIILPFALIGLKPLLRQLIEEQRRTNNLLSIATRRKPPPEEPPQKL
jgi:hypothetical protein